MKKLKEIISLVPCESEYGLLTSKTQPSSFLPLVEIIHPELSSFHSTSLFYIHFYSSAAKTFLFAFIAMVLFKI
jgi:hypothetical protein